MERDPAAEMAAARQGAAHALESLIERNLPPLLAFIRSRSGKAVAARESALDIAQSVFREVLQDAERIELQGEGAFRNLGYRIGEPCNGDRASAGGLQLENTTDWHARC